MLIYLDSIISYINDFALYFTFSYYSGLYCRKFSIVCMYLLADNETCQRKCRVTIYGPGENMNPGYFYALHTITGIFGDRSINDNKCLPSSQAKESHLRINCSSWKQGKNDKQVVDYEHQAASLAHPVRPFASQLEVRCSNPGRDRPGL